MPRSPRHRTLCANHAKREEERRAKSLADKQVARELASLSGDFKTASDVNHVLGKVLSLLAQGRIPRRDAVAFAYISQLLLQSLPKVQKEIKEALGFDAWQETLESALGAESDSAEAHDAAEDEVEDDDEDQVPPVPAVAVAQCAPAPLAGGPEAFLRADDNADDTPHPDQKFPPDRLRAIATAAFAKVLTAAARDEARDKITTRSAAEKKAPTIPDRPTGAILRSPGCGEGAEQRIEVTLGEGWGLHQPP